MSDLNEQERAFAEQWLTDFCAEWGQRLRAELADLIMADRQDFLKQGAHHPEGSLERVGFDAGAAGMAMCAAKVRSAEVDVSVSLRRDGYSADDFLAALRGDK